MPQISSCKSARATFKVTLEGPKLYIVTLNETLVFDVTLDRNLTRAWDEFSLALFGILSSIFVSVFLATERGTWRKTLWAIFRSSAWVLVVVAAMRFLRKEIIESMRRVALPEYGWSDVLVLGAVAVYLSINIARKSKWIRSFLPE